MLTDKLCPIYKNEEKDTVYASQIFMGYKRYFTGFVYTPENNLNSNFIIITVPIIISTF